VRINGSYYYNEKELGKGAYGTAYLTKNMHSNLLVLKIEQLPLGAESKIRKRTEVEHKNEVAVLKKLGIFRGEGKINKKLAIAMKYFPGVQLGEFLKNPTCRFDQNSASSLLYKLNSAFENMYDNDIVHGDIHWNNIIAKIAVNKGKCEPLSVNFIDYGFSVIIRRYDGNEYALYKKNGCKFVKTASSIMGKLGVNLPGFRAYYQEWKVKLSCE
jgi:serine/threonine protein kinase